MTVAPLSPVPRRAAIGVLRTAVVAVLVAGTAFVALVDWLGVGGSGLESTANGPVYDAVILGAALACLLRAFRTPAERAAWLAIALAVLLWAAAEIYWTLEIDGNPAAPYPSPADAGYLAFYPAAAAGLLLLVKAHAEQLDWRLWVDGLIAALGTAAVGAVLVFEVVADRTSGSGLEVATSLAYPLADIAILALAVGVVALGRWRPGRTWGLLLVGLGTMAFADISYTLQTEGVGILGGDWVEPFYVLSALFLGGAAAMRPRARALRPDGRLEGWRELAIPGFFAIVLIALFGLQYFSTAGGFATAMWAATMLAVLARLAMTITENSSLLAQVRTDALTGLGSQGSMQVDLRTRCEAAEQEPLTLLMLDLNGFKRYNDTFGHPAGDAMLRRLGGQLREAVGSDGTAYRIGGDEFGVLVEGDVDPREVSKRAAEALTAHGKGFALSAAWGSAAIPGEASTPATAMQLADVRMYAQKESRRLARDEEPGGGDPEIDFRLQGPRSGEAVEKRQ